MSSTTNIGSFGNCVTIILISLVAVSPHKRLTNVLIVKSIGLNYLRSIMFRTSTCIRHTSPCVLVYFGYNYKILCMVSANFFNASLSVPPTQSVIASTSDKVRRRILQNHFYCVLQYCVKICLL